MYRRLLNMYTNTDGILFTIFRACRKKKQKNIDFEISIEFYETVSRHNWTVTITKPRYVTRYR